MDREISECIDCEVVKSVKCAGVHWRSAKYTGETEMHWTEWNCIGEVQYQCTLERCSVQYIREVQCTLERYSVHWRGAVYIGETRHVSNKQEINWRGSKYIVLVRSRGGGPASIQGTATRYHLVGLPFRPALLYSMIIRGLRGIYKLSQFCSQWYTLVFRPKEKWTMFSISMRVSLNLARQTFFFPTASFVQLDKTFYSV